VTARNPVGNELSYRPASLCSLAVRYDNPIPTRFLDPIDCSKISAQFKSEVGNIPVGRINLKQKISISPCSQPHMMDSSGIFVIH
jgi:hypothetical protein